MKTLDKLIPTWLKKLDKNLLLKYPQIWITKIHYVLFFTVLFDVVIFTTTFFVYQYDIKQYRPDFETPFILLLLPAFVFYCWWFVLQSWYNSDKNYGKLTLRQDYGNFFIYWIVALLIYSTAASIPHAMHMKISNSLDENELKADFDASRKFQCYFIEQYNSDEYSSNISLQFKDNQYVVKRSAPIDWQRIKREKHFRSYNFEYEDNQVGKTEVLTEKQLIKELQAFEKLSLKYLDHSECFLLNKTKALQLLQQGKSIDYNFWRLESQISSLVAIKYSNRGFPFWNSDYLKVILGVSGFLALIVWVFKNVHWKNFVAGLVVELVIPFVIGIFGVIIYTVSSGSQFSDLLALIIVLLVLGVVLTLIIRPWLLKKHSSIGVISAITFQFWLPFLPLILLLLIQDLTRSDYRNYNYLREYFYLTYYAGILLTLVTIPIFKIYYRRMWALPKRK